MMMRFLVSTILSLWLLGHGNAADPLDDLRTFHSGGIAASEWQVHGAAGTANFGYHVTLTRRHRFVPTLIALPTRNAVTSPINTYIAPFAADFQWLDDNKLPLCMRWNVNLGQLFTDDPIYRAPLVPESIDPSPLVWRIKLDGSLSDERLADVLGSRSNWSNEGRRMGQTIYYQEVFNRTKNSSWTLLSDNNEGFVGTWKDATVPAISTPGRTLAWKPLDSIQRDVSLRLRNRVAQLGTGSDPNLFAPEYALRRKDSYSAFFGDLKAKFPGWNILTSAYSCSAENNPQSVFDQIGRVPDGLCYDGYGPSLYVGPQLQKDLTDRWYFDQLDKYYLPAWGFSRKNNPKSFREIFVSINGAGALAGFLRGTTEIIDPERFGAFVEWAAWTAHDPGVPVLLRHWIGAGTTMAGFFFDSTQQPLVGGLANLMQADYLESVCKVPDRIMENFPVYWREGRTIPQNYQTFPVKCWRVVVQHPTEPKWLVYLWTPATLDPDVKIEVEVPVIGSVYIDPPKPWAYYELTADHVDVARLDVP